MDFTAVEALLGATLLGGIALIGQAKMLALGTIKAFGYGKLTVSK